MKNFLIILAFSLFLFGCNQKNENKKIGLKTTSFIKKDISKVLNNWHKAASKADYNSYFEKMDSISVFIGTDATENWTKKQFEAYSKPHFDKGKAWSFSALERNIYVNNTGNFAWFDELLKTQMGTCRGSGVLENSNGFWKIKHYVLSVSIPNEDINAVILAKQKNDSIFLRKFQK